MYLLTGTGSSSRLSPIASCDTEEEQRERVMRMIMMMIMMGMRMMMRMKRTRIQILVCVCILDVLFRLGGDCKMQLCRCFRNRRNAVNFSAQGGRLTYDLFG